MTAKFVRQGVYEVTHAGQSITVEASHPCSALIVAFRMFKIGFETGLAA